MESLLWKVAWAVQLKYRHCNPTLDLGSYLNANILNSEHLVTHSVANCVTEKLIIIISISISIIHRLRIKRSNAQTLKRPCIEKLEFLWQLNFGKGMQLPYILSVHGPFHNGTEAHSIPYRNLRRFVNAIILNSTCKRCSHSTRVDSARWIGFVHGLGANCRIQNIVHK